MALDDSVRGQAEIGPPPPFDPELEAALGAIHAVFPPSLTLDELVALRTSSSALLPPLTLDELCRGGAFTAEDREVPGPPGAPAISLLICRPTSTTRPVPAVYFIHGGGMVSGDNRLGITEVLDWAQEFALAAVSIEYRLAPDTRHPGPLDDCYAGLVWTLDNATELGIDPARIVVAGESAGGGLAAGLTLLARDRGTPAISGQLLMSPMLDDRNDTLSARQLACVGVWDKVTNEAGWTALLGEARGGPDVSAYAAPSRATDLSGLPPVYIDAVSVETFRDEGVSYASAIWAAGGTAELHVFPGGFHGSSRLVPDAAISQEARAARARWLRRLLTR